MAVEAVQSNQFAVKSDQNSNEFFAKLFDNEKFSDVTLAVGDTKIPAHRNVLSARSEYFARMFDSDFKEAKDKIVNIQEENEELFKMMIEFIYTNDLSKLNSIFYCHAYDIAMDLIVLAQKYNISSLITACSKVILANLNVETCLDIIIVAETAQSLELGETASKYFAGNINAIIGTQKWVELKVENPVLALELATKVIENKIK
jgi:hypothetical protein